MTKKRMLVHICCAPDALYVMNLLKQKYDVAGFFYNPNIHPEEEYALRIGEARQVAHSVGFELIEAEYDKENWLSITQKFKDEPEKRPPLRRLLRNEAGQNSPAGLRTRI